MSLPKLRMLPTRDYVGVNRSDPIRFYAFPLIGSLYRRRVEMCLAQLEGGDRILEVGFGSGVTFLNLAEMYREIHGLDLTADVDQVTALYRRHGVETRLRSGSVLDLPYPDGYFDAVLMISILEHLEPLDQLKAFREVERVLTPGGQLVYGVPTDDFIMGLGLRLLDPTIGEQHLSSHDDIHRTARSVLAEERVVSLNALAGFLGPLYEVGHFKKAGLSSPGEGN
jgi:SAM-dependent methyltransferase